MMQNATPAPTRGVPVTLDRIRHLRYTLGTRKIMLADLGDGDPKQGEKALESLTGDTLAKVLWYGLKHDDPSLTVEQVEEIVDLENLPDVVNAMSRAMGYKAQVIVDGETTTGNPQ